MLYVSSVKMDCSIGVSDMPKEVGSRKRLITVLLYFPWVWFFKLDLDGTLIWVLYILLYDSISNEDLPTRFCCNRRQKWQHLKSRYKVQQISLGFNAPWPQNSFWHDLITVAMKFYFCYGERAMEAKLINSLSALLDIWGKDFGCDFSYDCPVTQATMVAYLDWSTFNHIFRWILWLFIYIFYIYFLFLLHIFAP